MKKHFSNYFVALEANFALDESAKAERRMRVSNIQATIDSKYDTIVSTVFDLAYKDNELAAIEAVNEASTMATEIDGELNALIESVQNTMNISRTAATDNANFSKLILVIVSLVAVLLAVIIATLIGNIIKRGVNDVARAAQKISKGDFDVSVGSNNKDEIAGLSNSLLEVKTVVQSMAAEINKVANNYAVGKLDEISVNVSASGNVSEQTFAMLIQDYESERNAAKAKQLDLSVFLF